MPIRQQVRSQGANMFYILKLLIQRKDIGDLIHELIQYFIDIR